MVKGIVLDFIRLFSSLFTSQFKNKHNLFPPDRIVSPMEGGRVGRSYPHHTPCSKRTCRGIVIKSQVGGKLSHF